jgi:hypothetical protein
VRSVICWSYGHVPQCQPDWVEAQPAEVSAAGIAVTAADVEAAGPGVEASPTAWAGDIPEATETLAPGVLAAASASCGLTRRVTELPVTGDGAFTSASACVGESGCGPPADAAGTNATDMRIARTPRPVASRCFVIALLLSVDHMKVVLSELTIKMAN